MDIPCKKLIAAALAATLHTVVMADTVELVNGDTLTGSVVSHGDGEVVIEHAQLGRVVLSQDQVRQVSIGDNINRAAQPEGGDPIDAPGGIPVPAPENGDGKPAPAQAAANAAEAAALEEPSLLDTFLNQWDTKLTLGFTGTSGNSDRQNYHAKFDTEHETEDLRWAINSSWFYAVANNVRSQNEVQTQVTRDWLLKDNPWFLFVRGEHEYDEFRAWENRASAFGGAGYTVIDDKSLQVKARMGLGGSYEFGQINEFTPEAFFGGSVAKWKINDRHTLVGDMTYYPSLEDDANYRIQTKLEWLYKLDVASGMSLKIGVQNDYESQTPGDSEDNDMKYYGALVISF